MHTSLKTAAVRANLGAVDGDRLQDFYMVTEPEAATMYILSSVDVTARALLLSSCGISVQRADMQHSLARR